MTSDEGNNRKRDRELGMDRPILRRDFLNGVAISIGAIGSGILGLPLAAYGAAQDQPGYYPPARTGMRGSHDGSFDVAHALRDHVFWKTAGNPVSTGEIYDLVVVGGGISGLAAAYYFRRQKPSAKILILDNHDDFGGHAKRNEFTPAGRFLLTNGGTMSIESPFDWSKEAKGLMDELGIDPVKLSAENGGRGGGGRGGNNAFANLQNAVFFDKETFGVDRLVAGAPARGGRGGRGKNGGGNATTWEEFLGKTPLSPEAQKDIARLEQESVDYMPGLTSDEKKDKLSRISYKDFLLNYVKVHPDVIPYYQTRTHGLYGVGIDAVGALELWPGSPGFTGMNLEPGPFHRLSYTALGEHIPRKPYNYHYPDGNASIARQLVRSLIPGSIPGHTAEDIVMAKADYSKLDVKTNQVRIRLNATAVRARHAGKLETAKEVEVVYSRDKRLSSVRAKAVVMACWNQMIPFLCEDLPDKQKQALDYAVKVPLVYTAVALKNWTAFSKLGIRGANCPGMFHSNANLEMPGKIGDYQPQVNSPEDPVLVRMLRTPCKPGLPARDQHRAGHVDLFTTPFPVFERNIRDQLARILNGSGFDPARDIDAITVNRWPHGYAYEYNFLWDPEWPKGESPCEIARKRFGRIAIANSDAAAAAYSDQAMDQAYRAVQEILAG
jgi:spermidine dehydrogenase